MDNENLEIKSALQTIELLKQYKAAKTSAEKDSILKQMDDIDGFVNKLLAKHTFEELITNIIKVISLNQYRPKKLQIPLLYKIDGFANRLLNKFSPDELITKITKAISLDKYRPKNLPITLFAVNKDLDYVNGEFDTFDRKLSQMFKTNEKPEKIRKKFKAGTANIYKLANQFSADWIRRLNNHKDLVDAARNANEENIIDAYNKLFKALAKDFCEEYDCIIDVKVVKDWATSDINPNDPNLNACHEALYKITYSNELSETEVEKIREEFFKDPKHYPNSSKFASNVRVSFSNTVSKSEPEDLFYILVSVFAHEMHHALDFQKPRQGALGSQIEYIDEELHVDSAEDEKAYRESATEISSYEIQFELFDQLKGMGF